MSKRAIFDKKNVLVAGGAGFIGSHLCDELIKDSKVICLDNFLTGDEKNIDHLLSDPNFEFIKHDINEKIKLESLPELQKFKIEFQGIQEIYNLACPTSPKNFQENIVQTALSNSVGVRNLLELAKKHDAKFLHFSSSVVYGDRPKDYPKIDETYIGKIDNLSERASYDEGKRFSETLVRSYEEKYSLDAKIIRVFRTYGPRMKLGDNQMIPDFINNALNNDPLTVLGDKNFNSTFCYVSDVVDAAIKMMDSSLRGPINIGSDMVINITEVAQKIIDFVNSSSTIEYALSDMFMTPLPLPDIAKARNELGWMPIITFEKGLEKTIDVIRASRGVRGINDII